MPTNPHRAGPALWRSAAAAVVVLVGLVVAWPARALPPGGPVTTETRLALVIGNAAYRHDPLDNPVNDARLIADSLKRSGFSVTLREDLNRADLIAALKDFGNRLNENTIAVLYFAGHGLQLYDRNFLIPVDAEIHSEDEIPIAGIDLGFILGRMSYAHSRINIVILDACRNNPFASKTVAAPPGLAQMEAPVGTLLAYATGPGKLAADSGVGSRSNSLYASYLAKHMLTPGLPVESVFKRVREGVVRDTQALQVPWESSSLQGEFAFVPGVAAGSDASPDQQLAAELAFWNSIQGNGRAEEYRAYLRQYPSGRFAALAQSRLGQALVARPDAGASARPTGVAAAEPPASGASGVAVASARTEHPELLPRVGDTWRYRVQDQFRLGDLYLTARVDGLTPDGVVETWTSTFDAQVRTVVVPNRPGFNALPGWTLTPAEFAPYLLASGVRMALGAQSRRVDDVTVALQARVEGEEDVVVQAGRFRAIKLVLSGQAPVRARGIDKPAAVRTEQVIWYAPEVRRIVKQTVSSHVGASLREATSFELTEARLQPP